MTRERGYLVDGEVAGRLYARFEDTGESSKKERSMGVGERVLEGPYEWRKRSGQGGGLMGRGVGVRRERAGLGGREVGR